MSAQPTDTATSSAAPAPADRPEPKPLQKAPDTPVTSSKSEFLPDSIPPTHENRTLVLCFDGTGDQFDDDNSNIVQLFSMLKKDDRTQQMVYYQAGIGTYTKDTFATPLGIKIAKTLDEAIAWYLDAHVKEGYHFLMQNYKVGDKICLFGFSRGAYTARALAGMIHKVGLLPADNAQQVPFAWAMYTRADDEGWKQSAAFKKAFSVDVDIEFLGVFDTVCSVGLFGKTLPFTTSNYAVRHFRHAVSLDERRAKFKANLWNKPTAKEETLGTQPEDRPTPVRRQSATVGGRGKGRKHLERMYMNRTTPTDIQEVWFAGCHCDVGGGSVPNGTPHSLARIALRWMIRQCFLTNTGIMFDTHTFRDIGMLPESLFPVVVPASQLLLLRQPSTATPAITPAHSPDPSSASTLVGDANGTAKGGSSAAANFADSPPDSPTIPLINEADETAKDAVSTIYDQLSLKWFWWILELIPIKHRYQRGDKSWTTYLSWNLGRARIIPKQKRGFMVHSSVRTRMETTAYKPRPEFIAEPTWVD